MNENNKLIQESMNNSQITDTSELSNSKRRTLDFSKIKVGLKSVKNSF